MWGLHLGLYPGVLDEAAMKLFLELLAQVRKVERGAVCKYRYRRSS